MKTKEIVWYVVLFVAIVIVTSFVRDYERVKMADVIINRMIERGIIRK